MLMLNFVGYVVNGEPGGGPGERLPQLLGPPQRLVDGARGGRPLHHVLQEKRIQVVLTVGLHRFI